VNDGDEESRKRKQASKILYMLLAFGQASQSFKRHRLVRLVFYRLLKNHWPICLDGIAKLCTEPATEPET
jgi:hypothetical protein